MQNTHHMPIAYTDRRTKPLPLAQDENSNNVYPLIQRMTRLIATAEREVVWSLAETFSLSRPRETIKQVRIITKTLAQLTDHGVAVKLLCPPELQRAEGVMEELRRAKPQQLGLCPITRSVAVVDLEMAVVRRTDVTALGRSEVLVIQDPIVAETFHHLLSSVEKKPKPHDAPASSKSIGQHQGYLKILTTLAEGHTDDLSAKKMGMSVRTYRRHVANIMVGIGAKSRFQAGAIAVRAGLLEIGSPH